MLEKHFSVAMPFWRFALNTLIASCLGLFPLLLLYIALIPGFGALLLGNHMALALFLRQVATDGLPVVFVVNYASFFLYAERAARRGGARRLAPLLLADPVLRVALFFVLHALVYFFSADWFGSFGGDHWLALQVVAPTMADAALFANLSGVYFYASIASALPVYATVIGALLAQRDLRRPAPLARRENRRLAALALGLALFAASALLLTAVAVTVEYLQPSYNHAQSRG